MRRFQRREVRADAARVGGGGVAASEEHPLERDELLALIFAHAPASSLPSTRATKLSP